MKSVRRFQSQPLLRSSYKPVRPTTKCAVNRRFSLRSALFFRPKCRKLP